MAGDGPELEPGSEVAGSNARARAVIGRTARRAFSSIAAAATGGTSKGAEVGLRLVLLSLPFLAVLAAVVLLAVVAAVLGFKSANGVTDGSCAVSVSGSQAPPANLLPIYDAAANEFQLGSNGWAYLAAINYVETDFGKDMAVSSAGAIGWMQFEPSTFVTYSVTVNGDGAPDPPDPYNPYDAIYAAANMLHADGAPGDWDQAIYAYNHADWYVTEVEKLAQSYMQGSTSAGTCDTTATATTAGPSAKITSSGMALAPASAPAAVQEAIAGGNQIIDKPYPEPVAHYGPLNQLWPAYDCSGSTSYVLYKAGLLGDTAFVSGQFESWGQPGPGQWITVYANSGHVFIEIAGIVLNTAWYAPVEPSFPSSGPRWQPASTIPEQIAGDQYGGFVVRHPAGL